MMISFFVSCWWNQMLSKVSDKLIFFYTWESFFRWLGHKKSCSLRLIFFKLLFWNTNRFFFLSLSQFIFNHNAFYKFICCKNVYIQVFGINNMYYIDRKKKGIGKSICIMSLRRRRRLQQQHRWWQQLRLQRRRWQR